METTKRCGSNASFFFLLFFFFFYRKLLNNSMTIKLISKEMVCLKTLIQLIVFCDWMHSNYFVHYFGPNECLGLINLEYVYG